MELKEFIEDIKLKLTGGILTLEISDEVITNCIKAAFREVIKYVDETRLIEVPFARCIDLKDFDYVNINSIYRTNALGEISTNANLTTPLDPMYAQAWLIFNNNSSMYNLNQYMLNYASYATYLQIRNTMSTDLAFKLDKQDNKLYINVSGGNPDKIVIEYIPRFKDVNELKTDYWIDILERLSLAHVKIILGNVRTRFTQTTALYTQDGEAMRSEGNAELAALREKLEANNNLFFPVD